MQSTMRCETWQQMLLKTLTKTADLLTIGRNVISLDVVHQPITKKRDQSIINRSRAVFQLAKLGNCNRNQIFVDLLVTIREVVFSFLVTEVSNNKASERLE
jgi:hypothetical protein